MQETLHKFYAKLANGSKKLIQNKIGFINEGYWKGIQPDSMELAQINFIETLVSFFQTDHKNVLDVACGRGAASLFLTKYFDPTNITGVDGLERHVEICRVIAPDCNFLAMDATHLEFPNESFDNVLCMEAAYHFSTRSKFLEEAYRILRSGGRLAVSDILIKPEEYEDFICELRRYDTEWSADTWPKENCLSGIDSYKELLLENGFAYVRIEDITEHKEAAFRTFCIRKAEREKDYERLKLLMNDTPIGTHCMVYAIKL
jgi:ubiquinone/menaquinone biosynthesis C-methylase UbiE